MVEIKDSTIRTIEELALAQRGRQTALMKSARRKRVAESQTLLKISSQKFGAKCAECNLDCEVKRKESIGFWANAENSKPVYTIETCPKQGHLERMRIKKHRR